MNVVNKKILIIAAIFVALSIITAVIYQVVITVNNSKDPTVTKTYVDPGSGETVIDTPNKSPEKAGTGDSIVFLGFTKLLDIGMTYRQVSSVKTDLQTYSSKLKDPVTEASIDSSSISSSVNSENNERTVTFTVKLNRKTNLNAEVIYTGLGNPSFKLYDSNAKQVY